MDEQSYIDILTSLKNAIESDVMMPNEVKEKVLNYAYTMDALLFPYSG